MCVILVVGAKSEGLSQEEIKDAARVNSDGVGAAWLEGGKVAYRKWADLKEVDIDLLTLPKPNILHFRLATVGGRGAEMCHPFRVTHRSKPDVQGKAKQVLFHNGHWGSWQEWLAITYSGKGHIPKGPYSDSRVMAIMRSHYGPEILNLSILSSQKIATFSSNGEILLHGSWDKGEDHIYRSNKNHKFTHSIVKSVKSKYVSTYTSKSTKYPKEIKVHCRSGENCTYAGKLASKISHPSGFCYDCRAEKLREGDTIVKFCQSCGSLKIPAKEKGFYYSLCQECRVGGMAECLDNNCNMTLSKGYEFIYSLCYEHMKSYSLLSPNYKVWKEFKPAMMEAGFTPVPGQFLVLSSGKWSYKWGEVNYAENKKLQISRDELRRLSEVAEGGDFSAETGESNIEGRQEQLESGSSDAESGGGE